MTSRGLRHCFHTCAIVMNHAVRCWGANEHGQLGDGTRTARNTPVAVAKEAPVAPARPEETVKTNEAEPDDIGKATELVNRGTE